MSVFQSIPRKKYYKPNFRIENDKIYWDEPLYYTEEHFSIDGQFARSKFFSCYHNYSYIIVNKLTHEFKMFDVGFRVFEIRKNYIILNKLNELIRVDLDDNFPTIFMRFDILPNEHLDIVNFSADDQYFILNLHQAKQSLIMTKDFEVVYHLSLLIKSFVHAPDIVVSRVEHNSTIYHLQEPHKNYSLDTPLWTNYNEYFVMGYPNKTIAMNYLQGYNWELDAKPLERCEFINSDVIAYETNCYDIFTHQQCYFPDYIWKNYKYKLFTSKDINFLTCHLPTCLRSERLEIKNTLDIIQELNYETRGLAEMVFRCFLLEDLDKELNKYK